MKENTLLITGGAGFIGSALIRHIIKNTKYNVINLDKLTYAGNLESLAEIDGSDRYTFIKGDICNKELVQDILRCDKPIAVMHLAAESHVDRSIDGPSEFIQTNIVGTFNLLECALDYWKQNDKNEKFRFQHISTDEVYGSLGSVGLFTEETKYDPSSPYSASKAASDHLVRAWNRTFGLPVLITNCSNNYGPYHYPEKLIPLIINNALNGLPLPVYGDGKQIRDWLFVEDHATALLTVFERGVIGETYNVGGDSEKTNLDVVHAICSQLDEFLPESKLKPHSQLISFVKDRPGHDRRYAIDCSKIKSELGWKQSQTFDDGIRTTVRWFLDNQDWVKKVLDNKYSGERLGVK